MLLLEEITGFGGAGDGFKDGCGTGCITGLGRERMILGTGVDVMISPPPFGTPTGPFLINLD